MLHALITEVFHSTRRMESKFLKFTLDLGFIGIANIVNFNILVLIYIYLIYLFS